MTEIFFMPVCGTVCKRVEPRAQGKMISAATLIDRSGRNFPPRSRLSPDHLGATTALALIERRLK
jgi:hypothetical protein